MIYKVASVQSLGTASFEGEGGSLKRTASESNAKRSYYVDGARKLDIRGLLGKVADKYKISANPSDYIFEAIRANTVNDANENGDCFQKQEMLRFDPRYASVAGDSVGAPVYMTYVGKPHHMNHAASDPTRARGVILDSHYNDDASPLEFCPTCKAETASAEARDFSGIHCAQCGDIVKDEFIEILVAIDTKKDKRLAKAILAGELTAGSMGCNCASTVCNVCDHTAHTVQEFCEHIRQGSKGSLWMKIEPAAAPGAASLGRYAGSKGYKRTTSEDVKALLRQAGFNVPTSGKVCKVSIVGKLKDGSKFSVRRAFEACQGVEFEEYSRVHKPADPKALRTELLSITAGLEDISASLSLEEETEQLLTRARLAKLEDSTMSRKANQNNSTAATPFTTFYAVRVNGDAKDMHIAASLKEAVELAQLGRRDVAEFCTIEAKTAELASEYAIMPAFTKSAQFLPVESSVLVLDGKPIQVLDENGQLITMQMDENGQPEALPGQPTDPNMQPGEQEVAPSEPSIEDVTQDDLSPEDTNQTPEEFGILPPGKGGSYDSLEATAEDDVEDSESEDNEEMNEKKYASVYGDFEIEIFDNGATLSGPSGEVLTFTAEKALSTNAEKTAFGQPILNSLLSNGLVRTASKFAGQFTKKFADHDGAIFDMQEAYPSEAGGAADEDRAAQTEVHEELKSVSVGEALENRETDMADAAGKDPVDSIKDRATDMAEAKETSATSTTLENSDDDMKEPKEEGKKTDTALDNADFNMKAKIASAESRYKKFYAAKVEDEKRKFAAEYGAKFTRAFQLAVKRAALNLELSPLKASLVDSLTVARPLGKSASTGEDIQFSGLNEALALHLVEAAWQESIQDEVSTLLSRTAEIMEYDEKYLASAEKDLAKQAAIIPVVAELETFDEVENDLRRRSAELRQVASQGNLDLAPSATDLGTGSEREERIRSALSHTKVSQLSEQLRATL